MSLTFPTGIQQKPSGLSGLPNRFSRPSFGTLYGFDAVGGDVVDGALLAENGDYLLTESGDYLAFETASSTTYTNSNNSLTVGVTGTSATFTWVTVSGATSYRLLVGHLPTGTNYIHLLTPSFTTHTVDLALHFSAVQKPVYAYLGVQTVVGGPHVGGPPVNNINF